jgi:hypothetical protein
MFKLQKKRKPVKEVEENKQEVMKMKELDKEDTIRYIRARLSDVLRDKVILESALRHLEKDSSSTQDELCKCGHEERSHGRVQVKGHPLSYHECFECDCMKFVSATEGVKRK